MTIFLLLVAIALLGWAIALIGEVGRAINKVDAATARDTERVLEGLLDVKLELQRQRARMGDL